VRIGLWFGARRRRRLAGNHDQRFVLLRRGGSNQIHHDRIPALDRTALNRFIARGALAQVVQRFIHGRFGSWLTIRRNRFDRALPCHRMGTHRCGHNDLVQLFAGQWLRVEDNRFGVYRAGGAQLYLTDDVDYATIVNNVFVGTDPALPGYRARVAMVIGSRESKRLPYYARVINNTILTGYVRKDGYAGSLRMSSAYGGIPRWKRPIVANNVIGLLRTYWRVCAASQRYVDNIVLHGRNCRGNEWTGADDLDALGRPRADSAAIAAADRQYAPRIDVTGRRRDAYPDIGAYEFRG